MPANVLGETNTHTSRQECGSCQAKSPAGEGVQSFQLEMIRHKGKIGFSENLRHQRASLVNSTSKPEGKRLLKGKVVINTKK